MGLRTIMFIGVVALAANVHAAPMEFITNGDFETGDFTGWTVTNSGSGNWMINDGSFNPGGPGTPLPPISGNFDAVSFQGGPGLHILSEQFVVPNNVSSAVLRWSERIRNFASSFQDPNQEWRVLIQNSGGGLIQEVYSTNPGDPLIQLGPNNQVFDLTTLFQSLEGQTIQVAFEQQDNLFFFNATLDNVSLQIDTIVPEPASIAIWSLLGASAFAMRRRRKK